MKIRYKKHKLGDKRTVLRFAWLPMIFKGDKGTKDENYRTLIWLRFYKSKQIYKRWGYSKNYFWSVEQNFLNSKNIKNENN